MPQARTAPVGTPMHTGFSTKIASTTDPDISFWERTVKPPAVMGGDAIDITTMHNTTWATKLGQALKELGEVSGEALYEPKVFDQIISLINVNNLWTVHFPDTDTLDFYGVLTLFDPQPHARAAAPVANFSITPTLIHSTTGAETAPVFTGSGTDIFG